MTAHVRAQTVAKMKIGIDMTCACIEVHPNCLRMVGVKNAPLLLLVWKHCIVATGLPQVLGHPVRVSRGPHLYEVVTIPRYIKILVWLAGLAIALVGLNTDPR